MTEEPNQTRACILVFVGLAALLTWLWAYSEGFQSKTGRMALIIAPIFTLIFLFALGN